MKKLEELDDILFELESTIDEEIEKQDVGYLPTLEEQRKDFEACRKGMML